MTLDIVAGVVVYLFVFWVLLPVMICSVEGKPYKAGLFVSHAILLSLATAGAVIWAMHRIIGVANGDW